MHAFEWIAHRGASYNAPENTLAAFRLAWAQGIQAIECDVYLSKDNHIIVFHDEDTVRIGGFNKPVKAQTLEELQRLDVGSWKGRFWENEKIPTLVDLLATVPAGGRVFIEIKDGVELLPYLEAELLAFSLEPGQIAIISFNYDVVVEAKKRFPEYEVLWVAELMGSSFEGMPEAWINYLLEKGRAANIDGFSLQFEPMLKKGSIDQIKNAGFKIVVWTVNELEDLNRLVDLGVDGITTDCAFDLKNSWLLLCQTKSI